MTVDEYAEAGTSEAAGVRDYFAAKAATYDLVESQAYWQLSDALLSDALRSLVFDSMRTGGRFLDIGGGTGRWTKYLLQQLDGSTSTLIDLSPEMVNQAENKFRLAGLSHRVDLIVANAQVANGRVQPNSYDLAICFHNVLGFASDPRAIIKQAHLALRTGGFFVTLVPNAYHATYFNLSVGRIDEAQVAAGGKRGRFTTDMPYIHLFTPRSIQTLTEEGGFRTVSLSGLPCFLYPGIEETTTSGNTKSIVQMLSDPAVFSRVLAMERLYIGDRDLAARGNNILLVGEKI